MPTGVGPQTVARGYGAIRKLTEGANGDMKSGADAVKEKCRRTVAAGREALGWIRDPENSNTVKPQREVLSTEFRRHIFESGKLEASVDRPLALGVFGVSQAGKSYFIGKLVSDADGVSHVVFDGVPGSFDFLSAMNPTGGNESTAVATRFTVKKERTPSGFPVNVRLLSVHDLVQIIGDLYYTGFNIKDEIELSGEEIQAAFDSLKAGTPAPRRTVVQVEHLWAIRDFFHRKHRDKINVNALRVHDYWERAETLVERLDVEGLVTLFEPIWARFEGLSKLFHRLASALASADFAEIVYCPIETLIDPDDFGQPRTKSVINVESLDNLIADEAGMAVALVSSSGQHTTMAREVLGALIAEVRLSIVSHALPFLNDTDVIDFPGLRTPEVVDKFRTALHADRKLFSRLFKDSKVRFLFEKFKDERELNALVLCIGPELGEVPALPGLIRDWIESIHGSTAEERAKTTASLFVVLTKFDRQLEDKPGLRPIEHWEAVLQTALLDRLSAQSDWLANWTPGRAFPNVFWFRNTSMRNAGIMAYDAVVERREIGLNPAEADRFERYMKGYLAAPKVQKYIADPQAAWDAVFKPNDGGLTRIVEAVMPVCVPGLRIEQIAGRIAERRRIMHGRLDPYHIATDEGSRIKRSQENARKAAQGFAQCAASGRIGRLMAALQVQDTDLVERFSEIARRASLNARGISMKDILAEAGLDDDGSDAPETGPLSDQLAAAAVEYWVASMRTAVEDPRFRSYLRLGETEHAILVDELVSASRRLDLRESIATQLVFLVDTATPGHSALAPAALVAANRINAFVYRLDYDKMAPVDRPKRPGGARNSPIFSEPPARGVERLTETPSSGAAEYYSDWIVGFRALVEQNAQLVDGTSINIEQNARLRAILEKLTG